MWKTTRSLVRVTDTDTGDGEASSTRTDTSEAETQCTEVSAGAATSKGLRSVRFK